VATGLVIWRGNGGASIGSVQAQAAVQARQYADPATDAGIAFRSTYPNEDLVFFGTRGGGAANRIWALKSSNGMQAWSLTPGNLDSINGGMVVDYSTNKLWVASRAGAGPSLRVINTVNPAAAAVTFSGLGDIDSAVVRNTSVPGGEIEVVNNSGTAYGFDPISNVQRWSYNVGGAVNGFLVPSSNGFLASTANGVQRFAVTAPTDGGTYSVAPVWPSPTAISGPSAPRIDASRTPLKLYVGDSQGRVHRIDYATGALEASFTVSTVGLGIPALDPTTTPTRLFVGDLDGRLCAINLPF
jgi:hypothetical protein